MNVLINTQNHKVYISCFACIFDIFRNWCIPKWWWWQQHRWQGTLLCDLVCCVCCGYLYSAAGGCVLCASSPCLCFAALLCAGWYVPVKPGARCQYVCRGWHKISRQKRLKPVSDVISDVNDVVSDISIPVTVNGSTSLHTGRTTARRRVARRLACIFFKTIDKSSITFQRLN